VGKSMKLPAIRLALVRRRALITLPCSFRPAWLVSGVRSIDLRRPIRVAVAPMFNY